MFMPILFNKTKFDKAVETKDYETAINQLCAAVEELDPDMYTDGNLCAEMCLEAVTEMSFYEDIGRLLPVAIDSSLMTHIDELADRLETTHEGRVEKLICALTGKEPELHAF